MMEQILSTLNIADMIFVGILLATLVYFLLSLAYLSVTWRIRLSQNPELKHVAKLLVALENDDSNAASTHLEVYMKAKLDQVINDGNSCR